MSFDLLEDVDELYRHQNASWIADYLKNHHAMRLRHPIYSQGWYADALSEHRFIPRLVWWMMQNTFWKGSPVVDVGTYDGTLVKALCYIGVDAFGYDEHPWEEMWDLLDIRLRMEVYPVAPKVVMSFNYAHKWRPQEYVEWVKNKYGDVKYIFADRSVLTPNPNNRWWFDECSLLEAGFSVFTFPIEGENKRDLLIRLKPR